MSSEGNVLVFLDLLFFFSIVLLVEFINASFGSADSVFSSGLSLVIPVFDFSGLFFAP